MAIDAYSLCPGGTGKKIKFCCSDLVSDLDKLDRMVEGEQYLAATQHVDRLLAQGQPRACLMTIKCMLLRATQQWEAARAHVETFLQAFPENPVAWAEAATLTAMAETGRAAMPKLQQALAVSGRAMDARVYMAIDIVAESLLEDGDWLAAQALWRLQAMAAPKDPHPLEHLAGWNRSAEVPLLMKSEPPLLPCPADARWKPRFDEATGLISFGRWQGAAEKLAALTEQVPDSPVLWQDLAILRQWLADNEGAVRAWRKFAALRAAQAQPAGTVPPEGPAAVDAADLPLEDAAEATALAMLLSGDPLGDNTTWLRLNWPLRDAERLGEALLSDSRAVQVPFDAAAMATEESPPPRAIYVLLDRPLPSTSEGLSLATVPHVLAQAMLFGRQTDREARLEIEGLGSGDLGALRDLLRALAPEALGPEPEPEVVQQISASFQMLTRRWNLPHGTTREQLAALSAEHRRHMLLELWPATPLGLLDGQTPLAAAAAPEHRVPLLAAILVLEHWCGRTPPAFDFNELRHRLGLPSLRAIEPRPGQVHTMSLLRLARVLVEKLPDEDLLGGFQRAGAFRVVEAIEKFGREILARPSFAERPERQQTLALLARSARSLGDALGHVEEGRRAAQAAGTSCAAWDLVELPFRFAAGHAHEAMQLVEHIETRHLEEPGVAPALTRLLVEVGLLNPDGTPVQFAPQPAGPQPEQAAAAPAAQPSGLWTPDSAKTSGGGKLWTPE
jgi:tetratricopeptide (TPR) repeat protein